MTNVCDQHYRCTLQCASCRSYECQDVGSHRELPWLHRRDWEEIIRQAVSDDMPDDREAYYNERAERMP
jgi:hypothetical protein